MMKTVLSLALAAGIMLIGCRQENSTLPSSKAKASDGYLYAVSLDGDGTTIQSISLDELKVAYGAHATSRTPNNQSANGHYSTVTGNATISFSAIQNSGGTHGQINFEGPEGGWDFHMDTECLEVAGNKAVIGGLITQVNHVPAGAEPFFIVGNYAYFYVEDHGEGNNDPSDRYERRIYWSSGADGPLCYLIPPSNNAFWGAFAVDVANESDQIQVND